MKLEIAACGGVVRDADYGADITLRAAFPAGGAERFAPRLTDGLNELREMFLKFFETKGHLRLPSFSLIPQNDACLTAHQLRHGAHEALVHRRAGAPPPPGDHLPEVHPHRRH